MLLQEAPVSYFQSKIYITPYKYIYLIYKINAIVAFRAELVLSTVIEHEHALLFTLRSYLEEWFSNFAAY